MPALQVRHRPRAARYETSGTSSNHLSVVPQCIQCDRPVMRSPDCVRRMTTFKKLPTMSPSTNKNGTSVPMEAGTTESISATITSSHSSRRGRCYRCTRGQAPCRQHHQAVHPPQCPVPYGPQTKYCYRPFRSHTHHHLGHLV